MKLYRSLFVMLVAFTSACGARQSKTMIFDHLSDQQVGVSDENQMPLAINGDAIGAVVCENYGITSGSTVDCLDAAGNFLAKKALADVCGAKDPRTGAAINANLQMCKDWVRTPAASQGSTHARRESTTWTENTLTSPPTPAQQAAAQRTRLRPGSFGTVGLKPPPATSFAEEQEEDAPIKEEVLP